MSDRTQAPFVTLGVTNGPGEVLKTRVAVGNLPDGTPVSLPLHIATGTRPGPTVCLTATVHGDERTGLFIVNELFRRLEPSAMRGTVLAFPVVSPLAFIADGRIAPLDSSSTNLNRAFPGSATGSIADRTAAVVTEGGITVADYVIDFHDGGIDCVTRFLIVHDSSDPELVAANRRLAAAYGAGFPVVLTPPMPKSSMSGMITRTANGLGIPALCVEVGGYGPIAPRNVEDGVDGLLRLLGACGVIEPVEEAPIAPEREYGDPSWVRATGAGTWHPVVAVTDEVESGQLLGVIQDVFGDVVEEVRAAADSIIASLRLSPVVMTGEWIAYCAPIGA